MYIYLLIFLQRNNGKIKQKPVRVITCTRRGRFGVEASPL